MSALLSPPSLPRRLAATALLALASGLALLAQPATRGAARPGRSGGSLVVALRAEPRTFNPVLAVDGPSKEIAGRLHGSLIRINRATLQTEPELATRWRMSPDGRRFTLTLRTGVRFSDGEPFGVDDVLFSFRVYLDPAVGAPQRDLLIVGGRPITVSRVDDTTVQFDLAQPYAAAERLFDGFAMLPRHRLEKAWKEGRFTSAWGLDTPPGDVVGLGPFRAVSRLPGERVVLERNPHYWKVDARGTRLPYLDRLILLAVPGEDAQVARFLAGDTHVVARLAGEQYAALERGAGRGYAVWNAGAGLEHTFLFFNLNDVDATTLPAVAARQRWFRDVRFRRAVSMAIDRPAIVRLAYRGRATALWGPTPPGYGPWVNAAIPQPARSAPEAQRLLAEAGFRRGAKGALVDGSGTPVTFTIATNTSNPQRVRIASLIQEDLAAIGIGVQVAPLEFRALIDRLTRSFDYDTAILSLGGSDADPNTEVNVWLSSGANHLWHPAQASPATPWEREIDRLMRLQVGTLDRQARKRAFDRVQAIVAEQLPLVPLASPQILGATRAGLANVRPAAIEPHVLWNVDELFWETPRP
ncbi:peptide ABC transporter substrate-binding protein [Luteitalea sp. TBR-22]|uniref:ABC transporter substrate-binding protein n=1 Tax=Luteitalea sp. TBR-22 TaxID=2802971 RepID=UPI001AFAFEED|nr:ABC transporter substrate-binding protein [Luteitalea sp. TBR-22]BCS34818.1 peptide ABC transporter substrate-binding protein [Luteitalea sp. TBR-22]